MKALLKKVTSLMWVGVVIGSFSPALVHADDERTTTDYRLQVVATGLASPWALAALPDGRLLMTEKAGKLWLINAEGQRQAIEGVPNTQVIGQGGLMDIELAPDFAQSRQLALSYVCGEVDSNATCVAKALFIDDQLQQVKQILRVSPNKPGGAHFGARLAFVDKDTLIVTTGDGFDQREQAQQLDSQLGKTLRIDLQGQPLIDNPFYAEPQANAAIFTYGHRNPQGLVYDAEQQQLVLHEHGPRGGDEINLLQAGKNYGWPIATDGVDYNFARISPYRQLPGVEPAKWVWTPSIAPSDMAIYRGQQFTDWQGDLLVTALAAKALYRVQRGPQGWSQTEVLMQAPQQRLRAVVVDDSGNIYVASDGENATLWRLSPR